MRRRIAPFYNLRREGTWSLEDQKIQKKITKENKYKN
jgi:hypothetical protein